MQPTGELAKHVSAQDLLQLLDIIEKSLHTGTEDEFRSLMKSTADLVPYQTGHVSVAQVDAKGQISNTSRRIVFDFPVEWFRTYAERKYHAKDPVAIHLLDTSTPLIWSEVRKQHGGPEQRDFYGAAAEHGLKDGFSFGTRFHRSPSSSFFVCAGPDIAKHPRHKILLNFMAPHLHVALSKVHLGVLKIKAHLSQKEIDVLNWAKFGKTNWEISLNLGVSERAARFHLENAIRKLGATNRTQAIALALSQGIIEWG